MILARIVFSVFACTSVTKYVFVSSEGDDKKDRPLEYHTFTAMIEILFTDGTKRVCTGTIIHDNVVITAAHCFLKHGSEYTDVEMSGSFIVVGTKKMFDTGYESYLPIERVITHPNYRGWTADLALVFTFAGMTTDKPGNVIPIVEENASTPVDSNATILSWGNYCEEQFQRTKKRTCTDSEEGNDSCEPRRHKALRELSMSKESGDSGEAISLKVHKGKSSKHRSLYNVNSESTPIVVPSNTTSDSGEKPTTEYVQVLTQEKEDRDSDRDRDRDGIKESQGFREHNEHIEVRDATNERTQSRETHVTADVEKVPLSIGSPYLIPTKVKAKKNDKITPRTPKKHRYEKANRNAAISKSQEEDTNEKAQNLTRVLENAMQRALLNKSTNETKETQPIEGRRSDKRHKHPRSKENKLTVQTFGFVNVQTCKKLIDKALPKLYRINTNEVVCYAAEDHFISDDDSGAAAVREGRLVAVTVGGAECEGDHVAVGMKMTCYCSWILENLPPGENKWKCCTNCCGEENNDHNSNKNAKKDPSYLRTAKHKNRPRKHSEEDE